MISNLHPYPDYRPSGIPWLGDVPAHWEVRRRSEDIASTGRCAVNGGDLRLTGFVQLTGS